MNFYRTAIKFADSLDTVASVGVRGAMQLTTEGQAEKGVATAAYFFQRHVLLPKKWGRAGTDTSSALTGRFISG